MNRRARGLQGEYEGKLRSLDKKFHNPQEGQEGPLVRRLRSFPNLQSYVIGAFGEVSEDVHNLIGLLADSRARYLTLSTGCAISAQERGQIIGQVRRKLSTAFIKASSLCTISRVSNVGEGSQSASRRRQWALREEAAMRRERQANWNAYMRESVKQGFSGGIHFFPG